MIATPEETQRLTELAADIESRLTAGRASLVQAESTDRLFMSLRLTTFALFFAFFIGAAVTQRNDVAMGILPTLCLFLVVLAVHRPKRLALRSLQLQTRLLAERAERPGTTTRARVTRNGASAVEQLLQSDAIACHRPEAAVLDELGITDDKRGVLGLADTTQTALGSCALQEKLSGVLREAADIVDDQKAVEELRSYRPLRLKLEEAYARCTSWSEQAAATFLNSTLPEQKAAAPVVLVVPFTLVTLGLGIASVELHSLKLAVAATLWAGIGNYIHRRGLAATAQIRNGTADCVGYLNLLRDVRRELAGSAHEAIVLQSIENKLRALERHPKHAPAQALAFLRRLGIYRAGLVYVFLNFLTLYDLYFTRPLIDYWHRARPSVQDALQDVAQLEALCALANMAEEQTGYTTPTIDVGPDPVLELTSVRHPVLSVSEAVEMDISLSADTHTLIVTGANMAGKSTLIRTLGAAVVLGSAGGSVPAASARISPLLLCSDINVTDSLRDGESTFGAEAKRVASIARTITEVRHTLVLLDEVFRGTNTHEKVAAGRALCEWIAAQEGLCVAATHDHELTTLSADTGNGIENVHFNADCRDGQLVFDYKLRSGPAPGTNALAVLADAGLPKEVVEKAIRLLPKTHIRQDGP